MSNGVGGTGAGAHRAAIAQAIKASGAIVRIEPSDFMTILSKNEKPLVVVAEGGFINKNYQYLMGCRGLVFFTKSATPLEFSSKVELITVKKIWIPG